MGRVVDARSGKARQYRGLLDERQVMPGDDHTTEEPAADPREEQAAEPHADIVARLLEYERRLREETGAEPARFGARSDPPRSAEAQPAPAETTETSEEALESEEPPPAQPRSRGLRRSRPIARTLKERIDRLDETLARISEMLPLLRGETKRDLES